jgi:hypothetical protein
MPSWRQLRDFIIAPCKERDTTTTRGWQRPRPTGQRIEAHVPWERTRGADAVAASFPYPYNNPIGAGIFAPELSSISPAWGGEPAAFVAGILFFNYPSPIDPIAETVQPGGPLYDPATLSALLGVSGGAPSTVGATGAYNAGVERYGFSF